MVAFSVNQLEHAVRIAGLSAFGLVQAMVWLGFIAALGSLILRGWTQRIILALVALAYLAAESLAFPAILQGSPAGLSPLLEKATGLAFADQTELLAAVDSVNVSPFSVIFLVVAILLGLSLLITAVLAFANKQSLRADKYVVPQKSDSKIGREIIEEEVSAIELWDSQK